jgi:type II secretory pathway predicted ATPase ExeA
MSQKNHFDCRQDPFQNDLNMDFFIESAGFEQSQARMLRGVEAEKSLCVLTGAPGSGKTMLAHTLYEALDEDSFEAGLLVGVPGGIGPGWLMTRVARLLGVEDLSEERMTLLGQIYEGLVQVVEDGRRTVVIVDEAQALASHDMFGEIRGLLNLEHEDKNVITIVLIGQNSLGAALDADKVVKQRIEARVELRGWQVGEREDYLRHRLAVAGGRDSIFEPTALKMIGSIARGFPRQMNNLADNAMYEAFAASASAVSAEHVNKAAEELRMVDSDEVNQEPALLSEPVDFTGGLLDDMDSVDTHHQATSIMAPAAIPTAAIDIDDLDESPAIAVEGPPKDDEDEMLDSAFADLMD